MLRKRDVCGAFVTRGAPTDGASKPTGKGFEFAPVTHPNSIFVGDPFKFGFVLDGKPVAAAAVYSVLFLGVNNFRRMRTLELRLAEQDRKRHGRRFVVKAIVALCRTSDEPGSLSLCQNFTGGKMDCRPITCDA